jgi:hypothetical protein
MTLAERYATTELSEELHRYMTFRAEKEGLPYGLDAAWFASYLKLACACSSGTRRPTSASLVTPRSLTCWPSGSRDDHTRASQSVKRPASPLQSDRGSIWVEDCIQRAASADFAPA